MSDNSVFAFSITVLVGIALATAIARSIEWIVFGTVAIVIVVTIGVLIFYFLHTLPDTIRSMSDAVNSLRPNVTINDSRQIHVHPSQQLNAPQNDAWNLEDMHNGMDSTVSNGSYSELVRWGGEQR